MSDNNLSLWDKVCETDPNFTKHVNQRGGYTAVSPQYQLREATKQFGSYGSTWGFESIDYDYSLVETMDLVLVSAVFFYPSNGGKARFPIKNSWPIKSGTRVDPDFAKKAETNTMSKALSKLGFSADVFLGQFDDAEYVNMMDAKARIESGDDEKVRAANDEFKAWFEKQVETIGLCPNERAINMIVQQIEPRLNDKLTIIKASIEKRTAMQQRLYKAADNAKLNLVNKQSEVKS